MKHFHLISSFCLKQRPAQKRITYDPYFIKRLGASIKFRLFTQAT